MTETSPLGTVATSARLARRRPRTSSSTPRSTQGRIGPPASSCASSTATASELPWDGEAFGELQVRGPWIASGYYNDAGTRQVHRRRLVPHRRRGTIEPDGYMEIVDRTKDVIKSGGEWISSVELENAIMAHPKVLEAAVIAVPHPIWYERPVAFVVPKAIR